MAKYAARPDLPATSVRTCESAPPQTKQSKQVETVPTFVRRAPSTTRTPPNTKCQTRRRRERAATKNNPYAKSSIETLQAGPLKEYLPSIPHPCRNRRFNPKSKAPLLE